MTDLPRLAVRPPGSRLVTRAEAATALGYSAKSLASLMSRHPDRWPEPVALLRVGRVWRMLWDLDALLALSPQSTGREARSRPTVSDSDGILTCLECGRRYRALGAHLRRAHDMTAAEYRDTHQLPRTAALAADSTRTLGRERMLAEDTSHLDAYRTRDRLAELLPAGIASARQTRDYEVVREHRLPGQRRAAQVMQARRAEALEARALARGYRSVADGIEQTREMPTRAAAAALGISATSVLRWRARL